MRYLTLILALAAGCSQATAFAQLPVATIGLPQTTLPGAACNCGCLQGKDCDCADCPVAGHGKKKAAGEGIARSASDAFTCSDRYGCPAVAFVGCPVQTVPGAISYACKGMPRVCVGDTSGEFACLGPDATIGEIRKACEDYIAKKKAATTQAIRVIPISPFMFQQGQPMFGSCPNCR